MLGPLAQALIMIGNAATPGRGFREGPFASEAELRELVDQAEQSRVIESAESRMIHSVFELGDTLVREVMVPRTDMVFIERHKTLRQMLSLALRSGFSRIPVIGDDLDDVIGIAYLKDVTKRVFDNREAETTERIESVMRRCFFVPDSKPADELMRDMQARRTHVAIVVDEYGGTAGLVTIEDLLEEIVGEITDEYDVDPDEVEQLPTGGVRVSSRLPVDDLAELFRVQIDDEDVETVGGLMAKHLGGCRSQARRWSTRACASGPRASAGRRNKVVTVVVTHEQSSGTPSRPAAATQSRLASHPRLRARPAARTCPRPTRHPRQRAPVPQRLREHRRPTQRRQVDAHQRSRGQQDRHHLREAADHPARHPRDRAPAGRPARPGGHPRSAQAADPARRAPQRPGARAPGPRST